jgi:hypothetical protein
MEARIVARRVEQQRLLKREGGTLTTSAYPLNREAILLS